MNEELYREACNAAVRAMNDEYKRLKARAEMLLADSQTDWTDYDQAAMGSCEQSNSCCGHINSIGTIRNFLEELFKEGV